jgi:hypothetical protein
MEKQILTKEEKEYIINELIEFDIKEKEFNLIKTMVSKLNSEEAVKK